MDLKDEIKSGEGYELEFKLVPNENREKYMKTAVAFANGRGGRILFGVANDGTVRGIPDGQMFQCMDAIMDSISNGCSPQIPMDISVEGDDKAVFIDRREFTGSLCELIDKAHEYVLVKHGLPPLEVSDDVIDVRVNVRRRAASAKMLIEKENQHIELEKQHIGLEKQHIGLAERHIDALNLTAPTRKNVLALYSEMRNVSCFGRKDVCRITGLSPRVASSLLSKMLLCKLIIPIPGQGKGRYRFSDAVLESR